jgi:hypothetical protein
MEKIDVKGKRIKRYIASGENGFRNGQPVRVDHHSICDAMTSTYKQRNFA